MNSQVNPPVETPWKQSVIFSMRVTPEMRESFVRATELARQRIGLCKLSTGEWARMALTRATIQELNRAKIPNLAGEAS